MGVKKILNQVTASERIEELINHIFRHTTFESFDVRRTFEKLFGEEKVTFIYPKNIFEKDSVEQVFYVFHGKFISEVKRISERYEIETYPLNDLKIRYQRSEKSERGVARLELHLNFDKVFVFDSKDDNSKPWKNSFTAIIQDIYSYIVY